MIDNGTPIAASLLAPRSGSFTSHRSTEMERLADRALMGDDAALSQLAVDWNNRPPVSSGAATLTAALNKTLPGSLDNCGLFKLSPSVALAGVLLNFTTSLNDWPQRLMGA